MKYIIILLLLVSCTFNVEGADTNTVSSTVVTNNTPPTANSPGINSSNANICKTGISGAVQSQVIGISSGVMITDEVCQLLGLSKMLAMLNLKVPAASLLATEPKVFDAMWFSAVYPPSFSGAIGESAKLEWEQNPEHIPEGSIVKKILLENKQTKEKEKKDAREVQHKSLDIFAILAFVAILL